MSEKSEVKKQDAGACGPECACGTSGSSGRGRRVAGIVILVVAGALVVRAVVKDTSAPTAPATTGFATLATSDATPGAAAKPLATDALPEIGALSELNAVADDTVGVFVFLPGKTEATAQPPTAQIRGAARTMEPQLNGGKIGLFTLTAGSRDYEQVSSQMPVPGVLAMVKGGGMAPVSGEITETKLVQAYVTASSAGGCGTGGCGPSGCN